MSLEAEHLADDAFAKVDEDFSYATSDLGEKMNMDLQEAKQRQQERQDLVSGTTKAREKRMQASTEIGKYYIGDLVIPIEKLYPPKESAAYRGYSEEHAIFCAAQMQTQALPIL
eukprot:TRINITY_DN8019_c0_g1_i5.p1 TRINITY_DN8019_c0_g1~~TRINITY_DN8019_c0_g1_i5.p1  ORF type:complete len:114 (-),score=18.58 TRINITY_DN8019_c0_g1_i5:53-394(-)